MFRAMHLPLLGCLLGTSGCHGLPPAPPAPSAAVSNYGEVIDYLQRHIRREMERQDVPGLALALVDDQQLVWARGFGYADRQHRINASEHTAFHAGDLSKLLIASATLQLAERGQLSRRSAPGHLARVLRTLTLPCRPERGGSRDHFPPAAQPSVRPSWRTPAAPVRRTPELTRPTAGESIRCLAEQSAGNPGRPFQPWLRTGRRGHRAQHRKALRAAHAGAPAGPFADDSLQLRQERPAPGATRPRLSGGGRPGSASDLPVNDLWSSPVDLSRFVRMLFANGRHKERQLLRKHSVEEMFRQQNAGNALDFDCQVGLAWFLSPCGSAPLEGASVTMSTPAPPQDSAPTWFCCRNSASPPLS